MQQVGVEIDREVMWMENIHCNIYINIYILYKNAFLSDELSLGKGIV